MSQPTRMAEALAAIDGALYPHRTRIFAALSAWIAAGFIGSCLVASAPPLEAVGSGLALGLATFGLLNLRLWIAERFGEPASESPARREPKAACEVNAVRHRRPWQSSADRVPSKGA